MDQAYEKIFSRLYSSPFKSAIALSTGRLGLLPSPNFRKRVRDITSSIEEAANELEKTEKKKLRSDAKYFLFINMAHMLEIPLEMHGETNEYTAQKMKDDIKTVVKAAAALQNADEPKQVSGHRIIEALSQKWSMLHLSSLRIWGKS
ncbi:MAG TPA: hypothetical protein VKZ53_04850 [Candidatus Angelobacter sp.]|nr:hypothetical protein [Candidatus Angelobacter sp.]